VDLRERHIQWRWVAHGDDFEHRRLSFDFCCEFLDYLEPFWVAPASALRLANLESMKIWDVWNRACLVNAHDTFLRTAYRTAGGEW
jgi:hypothetical protein